MPFILQKKLNRLLGQPNTNPKMLFLKTSLNTVPYIPACPGDPHFLFIAPSNY